MSTLDLLRRITNRNGLDYAIAALLLTVPHNSSWALDENEAYFASILALGAAHNAAYPPSLVPGPNSAVFGGVTYSTNLLLKYVPRIWLSRLTENLNPIFLSAAIFAPSSLISREIKRAIRIFLE